MSINNISQKIKELFFRFPLVVADFVIGTAIALYIVDHQENVDAIAKILIITIIGFFLFLAGYIFSEKAGKGKLISNAVVVIILALYYFFLPQKMDNFSEIHAIRTFLMVLASIMAIMVAPYLKKGEVMGFWQYNKKMFFRLAFTGISSGTLFLGIAASLASFDYLFNVHIDEEWYARVWIFIVGIIATTVFTSGIPKNYEELAFETEYPKVIKIFTQFVLLPLIGLYAIILYLYGGKIILTGEWPKGVVSYLVLIFSSIGVAANLLLYPERDKSPWVRNWSKIFWIALIPLVALLWGAVKIRITEYGITYERLFIIILGGWMLGLAIYFMLGKNYDIKAVFVSFIALVIVFVFSPINVFMISKYDQMARLEKILARDNILIDGKIRPVDKNTISKVDAGQISSIVEYLAKIDETKSLQKWFDNDLNFVGGQFSKTTEIMKLMGLEYVSQWDVTRDDNQEGIISKYFETENISSYKTAGHNFFADFDLTIEKNMDEFSRMSIGDSGERILTLSRNKLYLKNASGNTKDEEFEIDLNGLAQDLLKNYDVSNTVSKDKMTLDISKGKARIYISNIILEKKNGDWEITGIEGRLFFD